MKKILIAIFLITSSSLVAQNFQVHYDFGKGRHYITTTLEYFKADKWGSTFTFVDFDHNIGSGKNPSLAYMEIARSFTLGKSPLSAQVEYDGGLLMNNSQNSTDFSYPGYPINNAYLAGVNYGWNSSDYSKILNFQVLYKYIAGKNPVSFQLTGVWDLNFFKRKMTLSGFADFWREDNTNYYDANGNGITPTDTKFTFISEPQIWYNFTPNISLGSEWEFAVNFGTVQGLKVCPTLGAKWTF